MKKSNIRKTQWRDNEEETKLKDKMLMINTLEPIRTKKATNLDRLNIIIQSNVKKTQRCSDKEREPELKTRASLKNF